MRKICRTILAAGLMACMMMPAVNVMATDDIVGNWQADEAGVGFAKISASLVGLDGLCININENDTADIIFAVDGDETKTVKNVKIEEKEGEKYFDVNIPDADSPSLSEGQKKLAEIAEKFGLEGFGNIVVDDDGRLKIQAEFEKISMQICISPGWKNSHIYIAGTDFCRFSRKNEKQKAQQQASPAAYFFADFAYCMQWR